MSRKSYNPLVSAAFRARLAYCFLFAAIFLSRLAMFAADTVTTNASAEFDRANKLYEQGKFSEATSAYQILATNNPASASVWFNLGNAAYKSGQIGQALAAYRVAERLTPRDSALRANLQFVRGKAYSNEHTRLPFWKTFIRLATVNEWAMLAMGCVWIFWAILAAGELTRRRYPKSAVAALGLALIFGTTCAVWLRDHHGEAVIVAREATARRGPVDESPAAFQLRDGADIKVLETKGDWLEVTDAERRTGWVRRDEVFTLPNPVPAKSSAQSGAT